MGGPPRLIAMSRSPPTDPMLDLDIAHNPVSIIKQGRRRCAAFSDPETEQLTLVPNPEAIPRSRVAEFRLTKIVHRRAGLLDSFDSTGQVGHLFDRFGTPRGIPIVPEKMYYLGCKFPQFRLSTPQCEWVRFLSTCYTFLVGKLPSQAPSDLSKSYGLTIFPKTIPRTTENLQ